MFLHKLRAAAHLAWLLVWANVSAAARAVPRGPRAALREWRACAVRLWIGITAGVFLRSKVRAFRVVRMCLASGVPRPALERNLEAAVVLAERDIGQQKFERAVATVTPHIEADPDHPRAAKCLAARSLAHIWHGHFPQTIADLNRCAVLRPRYAQGFNYLANLAQVHGIRGEVEEARRAMAVQCGARPGDDPVKYLTRFLKARVAGHLAGLPQGDTVGVLFGAYHTAFGHAILDPFHFYNLFRHRFDHLVVIHPPMGHYSRATVLMVDVMRQYVETLDISAPELSPFAWQYLGELSAGNMTFLCMNYWAMNRMAFHARRDPDHPMSRGRRYVELPAKIVERAEAICRRNRLDPSRPVVVLHARSHGYHRLKVQSFRNVEVRNYVPAVRRLLDLGYQVVRIGERGMESLRGDVPGIVELPLLPHYDNTLDAYFLSRCRFMISCQSGPCSLARAMGKPNLVANAVYHHTMLPESDELFLFKRYRDVGGSPLCLEEILARGGHLFDKSSHFEAAGIELEDATADEILAATEEMLTRLENPTREDTPAQAAFRELMNRFAAAGPGSHPLATLMTDYIGYGLPEGRVSDAVCRLRPGYVSPARPARAA